VPVPLPVVPEVPEVPDVPLPVVPEVPLAPDVPLPLVPLAGGVAFWSLGVVGVAGVVVSGPVPGVGDAAGGVVFGVADGVVALSVVPVPVSAARFLQPASVAVARMALNSSVVLNVFMVFSFQYIKAKGNTPE
jgi:hypothetical protein